jgi:protein-S-isoprenylcysteine O-methyltransferase Ste14
VNTISRKREDLGAEFPHGDQLHAVLPIPFLVVWILDSFVYQFSTVLAGFVPIAVRLILAGVSLGLAFLLMGLSHKALFDEIRDPPTILDTGVFAKVRHPMYLGVLLIYIGFIFATLSLLSLGIWILIFLLYDKMATYEEKDLIRMFGDAYLNYQHQVPKWLPRMTSLKKKKSKRTSSTA